MPHDIEWFDEIPSHLKKRVQEATVPVSGVECYILLVLERLTDEQFFAMIEETERKSHELYKQYELPMSRPPERDRIGTVS